MVVGMDAAQRKRLITDLTRLTASEFEAVIAEVRSRPNTQEQGAEALRQAFATRAATDNMLGPLFLEPAGQEE
jgi:hypothetical protein